MLDYLIVGQGIAGSLLSWFLLRQNQKVVVIDKGDISTSSKIASGISNPITGRRFVKTWMVDDLFSFAQLTYQEFERLFGQSFYSSTPVIKLFDSIKSQNDWSLRCASYEYLAYLKSEEIIYLDRDKVKNDFGGFEIRGATRLKTAKFLKAYRDYLLSNNNLVEEKFTVDEMRIENDDIFWKDLSAKKIIFCEGAFAVENPYFKYFPFQLAKGERLKIKMKDFYADRILIGEVLVMPEGEADEYYIGATHDWYFDDDQPSEKGKNELLANLRSFLKAPFEVVGHESAIRPTVKDRRPFIGFHPEFPQVGIFNGMGTKGLSLAPYFANHFAEHILNNKTLMPEVDIKRFL
ncbi:MAG: FAD-binding oxidoreductase [Bacteroidetes bacterium]|nr:FAD-binding oxidoreductase [Bacteroidota bacterium]